YAIHSFYGSPLPSTSPLFPYTTLFRSRVLDGHRSVQAGNYVTRTPERTIRILGVYTVRIGVDSITLDDRGEWLYYGPFSGDRLYRIGTRDLNDESLAPEALGARVETFGP